ncbi:MAG TPA: hypothetical protein VLT85_01225 [Terriglobales bacterium]|nr:hypothetical protein [Terriglobales bacterium]
MKRIAVLAFALTLLAPASMWSQEVNRVEIASSWGGLGEPRNDHVTIIRESGQFYRDGRSVDGAAVEALRQALEAPPLASLNLENLGLTQSWLIHNASPALEDYAKDRDVTPRQRTFFLNKFLSVQAMKPHLLAVFGGGWTDDFPEVKVVVTLSSGEMLRISSKEQPIFMLPWGVESPEGPFVTYNADISRAIAALLPKGAANRDRLAGTRLRAVIANRLVQDSWSEWNQLEAEDTSGPGLSEIEARFTIRETEGRYLSSVDVDGRASWNAKLTDKRLPASMVIGVSLPVDEDGRLKDVEPLLTKVDSYEALALSPVWFRMYLVTNPKTEVEIRFVRDRSLSLKAGEDLLNDLRKHGKESVARELEAQQERCVFLEVNDKGEGRWSRWVVLPDGRMVLWHFQGGSVLNWRAAEFSSWDFFGWHSVGAVIASDGRRIE